jgi:hypothetical protein
MIFSIQRYLEDYFSRSGFDDPDQYAVALANLYDRERLKKTELAFLSAMSRMRTIFYRRNKSVLRPTFQRQILLRLDNKFKKKVRTRSPTALARGSNDPLLDSEDLRV